MKTATPGVEKMRNGKFRASAGSGNNRASRVFVLEEDAIRYRLTAQREIVDARLAPAHTLTVREWGRVWLPTRCNLGAYGNDRQRWASHVLPAFGDRTLGAVSRAHVRSWLRALEARGLAASTIRNCRSLLSVAFEAAVEDELVVANPCAGVKVKVQLPPISDDSFLYPDEQAALLAAADEPILRAMIGVAMGAGLRRGELFALHLRDVHLDDATPHLVVRYGGFAKGGRLKRPKNKKERRVPLFGLALEALRAWLEIVHRDVKPQNPHGLVFPHASGARRVYSRDLPASWKTARKAVTRIDPWWHLLRHTCASSLIAGWWGERWSLVDVSKFLGHSSVAVTERYAHLAPSVLDERAAQMPLLTLRTDEKANMPKLFAIAGSRPGDLKGGPTPESAEKSEGREQVLSNAALRALRAYLADDPTAVRQLAALALQLVQPAELAALTRETAS